MSRGPGNIERRIADLFAATRHRALDVDAITDHAFALKGKRPTRAQRLSATRAAHRMLRRVREMDDRSRELFEQADDAVRAKLGREKRKGSDDEYLDLLDAHPDTKAARALRHEVHRIGARLRFFQDDRPGYVGSETEHWQAITLNGRLRFYPADLPAQIWAVTVDAGGVHWFDAEITGVTGRNVMVRYDGVTARLDRDRLFRWWAFWRGVRFVSRRTGRIAAALDDEWQRRYRPTGAVPPSMQMPLAEARALLGVPDDYDKAAVLAAFRHAVKKAHPDVGGTPEMFRLLVEARDRLLAALGTSAPPPKPPQYAPPGWRVVYRRVNTGRPRLGAPIRRLKSSS